MLSMLLVLSHDFHNFWLFFIILIYFFIIFNLFLLIFFNVFVLFYVVYCMLCFVCDQSSEELDTDTEFEPVEDMTIETRSRCKILFYVLCFYYA